MLQVLPQNISNLIAAGEVGVVEVTRAALAQIAAREKDINAYVTVDEEGALAQAAAIQEKIDNGDTTFVYHIDTNAEIARNLKGHLMLVHGDMDNNVHPANSIRVVNALIRAGKRFDFLYLPGQRHGFGDMNEYFFWRMADYYSEWLLGDTQRPLVDVYQINND